MQNKQSAIRLVRPALGTVTALAIIIGALMLMVRFSESVQPVQSVQPDRGVQLPVFIQPLRTGTLPECGN